MRKTVRTENEEKESGKKMINKIWLSILSVLIIILFVNTARMDKMLYRFMDVQTTFDSTVRDYIVGATKVITLLKEATENNTDAIEAILKEIKK